MAKSCIKTIKAENGEMTIHICAMLDSCDCNMNCKCRNKREVAQGD